MKVKAVIAKKSYANDIFVPLDVEANKFSQKQIDINGAKSDISGYRLYIKLNISSQFVSSIFIYFADG